MNVLGSRDEGNFVLCHVKWIINIHSVFQNSDIVYTSISDRYSKESEWISVLRGWITDSETSGNCAAVIVAVIRKRR